VATQRIPDFTGQVMAVNRVARLLRKVSKTLDEAGVPYAVIGGNAVAAWVATVDDGAVRATKDVDILLRRADLPAAAEALGRVGLDEHEVLGVTMFLDRKQPNPKTGAHVIFAGEKVRLSSLYAAPDVVDAVRSQSGFLVIGLPALVAMKLESYRRVDQVHIEDLLSLGLIGDDLNAKLPADLRERLRQVESTME